MAVSIITHKRAIVPTLWPNDLGRAATGGFDEQVKENCNYVPETFEDVCDWARIVVEESDGDGLRLGRRLLVYHPLVLPSDKRDVIQPVAVILQGFLGAFNLSVLGNWDKKDRSIPGAVQHLTLESGGVQEVFGAQVRALRDLRAFVCAKLGPELEREDEIGDDAIRLEHLVFTKVRPSGNRLPAISLTNINDPGGRARKVASQWRVDHLIPTGVRRGNGRNMEIASTSFRRGDFVEVCAYADIQRKRVERKWVTIIKFAMAEVVKLWAVDDVKSKFTRTDVPMDVDGASTHVSAIPSVFRIGSTQEGFAQGAD